MSGGRYDGPIIDAHHHLWDLGMRRHPWLASPDGLPALGNVGYLQQDYGVADYLDDARDQHVVGSVHVEAYWDRGRSPVEETRWLDTLDKARGIAARYVAFVPLARPEAAAILEQQASHPRVAAVRATIRWHPDPARRWTGTDLLQDPAWRAGVTLLGPHRLALDLLMNAHQAEGVARLAAELPGQVFIVNHCGVPDEGDAEGMARWRQGLATMAAVPNIAIKLANFSRYHPPGSIEGPRRIVMQCLDAFGARRAMFASNYPVVRDTTGFTQLCAVLKDILRPLSASEQRAVFHDNAHGYYRF